MVPLALQIAKKVPPLHKLPQIAQLRYSYLSKIVCGAFSSFRPPLIGEGSGRGVRGGWKRVTCWDEYFLDPRGVWSEGYRSVIVAIVRALSWS